MALIKIQCGCGQRYAFDADLLDERLGAPIACPVCGADGRAAANALLTRALAPHLEAAPNSHVRDAVGLAEFAPNAKAKPWSGWFAWLTIVGLTLLVLRIL